MTPTTIDRAAICNDPPRKGSDPDTAGTVPLMPARLSQDGLTCSFICPVCGVMHTHGAQAGHAVAHCIVDGSPYRETGYDLMIVDGEQNPLPKRGFGSYLDRDGRRRSFLRETGETSQDHRDRLARRRKGRA